MRAKFHLRFAWGNGMYPQVVEEFKRYGELAADQNDSEFGTALEQGFHSGGWKGALTKAIQVREAQRKTSYAAASGIAQLYAALGEKDEALRWLDIAYQEGDWLNGLRTDFHFDSLRSDPRLAAFERKVGLPQ